MLVSYDYFVISLLYEIEKLSENENEECLKISSNKRSLNYP